MTAEGSFWAFSLHLYGRPGVPEATLRLQDECGADVDLVLYVLWRAWLGWRVDEVTLAAAEDSIAPWREKVVRPLRAVRRAMKAKLAEVPAEAAEALRGRIKDVELEAERLQHAALERHAARMPGVQGAAAREAAAAGIVAYATRLGITFPAEATATLLDALPF